MSEQIREQISAFLDGELPDTETELLLKRLEKDPELRDCFGRYALIAEVTRDPKTRPLSRDFTQRVNRCIDGDGGAGLPGTGLSETGQPVVAVTLNAVSRARHWWRPVAGAVVAAGVATIAVIALERRADVAPVVAAAAYHPAAGVPAAGSLALVANTGPQNGAGKSREAVSYTVPAAGSQATTPDSIAVLPAARLTNYVFAHSKYSSALGQRNVLSGLIADQPEYAPDDPAGGSPASARIPSQP